MCIRDSAVLCSTGGGIGLGSPAPEATQQCFLRPSPVHLRQAVLCSTGSASGSFYGCFHTRTGPLRQPLAGLTHFAEADAKDSVISEQFLDLPPNVLEVFLAALPRQRRLKNPHVATRNAARVPFRDQYRGPTQAGVAALCSARAASAVLCSTG